MFSKKAPKIDELFTTDLTLTTYCQIDSEDFVNFWWPENMNFTRFFDFNWPWQDWGILDFIDKFVYSLISMRLIYYFDT